MKAKSRKLLESLLTEGEYEDVNARKLKHAFLDVGATVTESETDMGFWVESSKVRYFIQYSPRNVDQCTFPRNAEVRSFVAPLLEKR